MESNMIEISHLVKRYGAKFAVDDISFSVGKGEIVGFLGPNGAGKSTTMNILTGYLSSTSGTVKVGGIDVLESPYEAKKLIGFLPEQPPLYMDMKVDEYLNFVYDLKKCTLNRVKHLKEVCEVTKIADVRGRLIKNLSKGYRQRVGIAHILPEVQAVADRIVIINQGKIVADEKTENITRVVEDGRKYSVKICGPQREVLAALKDIPGVVRADAVGERELDSFTYHIESEPGVDVRKSLFFALAAKNWPILGLEAVGMSLEDVFVKLMDADARKRSTGSRSGRA